MSQTDPIILQFITWALQAMIIGGVGVIWLKIENNSKDISQFRLEYEREAMKKKDFIKYEGLLDEFRDYLQREKGKDELRKDMQARYNNDQFNHG